MMLIENLLIRYFHYLDSKGKGYNFIVGLIWTAGIGIFDFSAPVEAKHAFFYILPVAFVTWFSGIRPGIIVSLLCTFAWSCNNLSGSLVISAWNVISTLLFFLAVAALLHKTHLLWENEKTLSRTDPLTGAVNLRAFCELVEYEMLRSQRDKVPFSLAYLDLDDFKQINDTYGHAAGDALLRSIVSNILGHLRRTDVVGRLGGDEFAIFFPATDQTLVQGVVQKVRQELTELMKECAWPTTFSMGVVTCTGCVHDLEKLISYADMLMYEVKRAGKNDIRYAVYEPESGRQGP